MPKEKPQVNIGEVIKTYRSQRGLSQGDIERRTGLLRCYLSRVENGHTVPSLETLAKIAEAMEISLADFFPGTETSHDKETQKMLGELSQDVLWIRDAETLQWIYLTPAFETIYGHYFDRVIVKGGKAVLERSVARYVAAVEGKRGYE